MVDAKEGKEEEDQLSFGERCSQGCTQCQTDFAEGWTACKQFSYNEADDTYCGATCSEWGWISLFLGTLYCIVAAYFFIMFELETVIGTDVLWGFFYAFLGFVAILAIIITKGQMEHTKNEIERQRTREEMGLSERADAKAA